MPKNGWDTKEVIKEIVLSFYCLLKDKCEYFDWQRKVVKIKEDLNKEATEEGEKHSKTKKKNKKQFKMEDWLKVEFARRLHLCYSDVWEVVPEENGWDIYLKSKEEGGINIFIELKERFQGGTNTSYRREMSEFFEKYKKFSDGKNVAVFLSTYKGTFEETKVKSIKENVKERIDVDIDFLSLPVKKFKDYLYVHCWYSLPASENKEDEKNDTA